MNLPDHPTHLVSGPVLIRPAALQPRPAAQSRLSPAERATEITRWRAAIAASLADLDRLAPRQETVGGRQWIDDRRRALQHDAWTGRITHLIDRDGLPAGSAVERASAWLLSLRLPVAESEALVQVALWVRLRLDGPEQALPPRSLLGLERVTPDHLLPLDWLRPAAVVAGALAMEGLVADVPIIRADLPPHGEQVVADLTAGTVRPGRLPGTLPVLEPVRLLVRWEEVAAVALGPSYPDGGPVGIDLDKVLRNPFHPGSLRLIAGAARKADLAIGGRVAYDTLLLPVWCGIGIKGWIDPPDPMPPEVPAARARAAWRAASRCSTAAEVRKALSPPVKNRSR